MSTGTQRRSAASRKAWRVRQRMAEARALAQPPASPAEEQTMVERPTLVRPARPIDVRMPEPVMVGGGRDLSHDEAAGAMGAIAEALAPLAPQPQAVEPPAPLGPAQSLLERLVRIRDLHANANRLEEKALGSVPGFTPPQTLPAAEFYGPDQHSRLYDALARLLPELEDGAKAHAHNAEQVNLAL